jgi:hypothetical protein
LQLTIEALDEPGPYDHVEMWRSHNARAAGAYLEELLAKYS